MVLELTWWKDNIMNSYNSIQTPEIDKVIYTNVSNAGWGIFSDGVKNGGRWTTKESELHITCLFISIVYF